jgi:hypothetical protein
MTCIGLSTAQEQNFDIVTADGKFHEALLTTDEDAIFKILLRTNNRPQPNKKHSQIHRAESDVLQIQYPLGLTE